MLICGVKEGLCLVQMAGETLGVLCVWFRWQARCSESFVFGTDGGQDARSPLCLVQMAGETPALPGARGYEIDRTAIEE